MHSDTSAKSVVPEQSHTRALQRAHRVLEERLCGPTWGADDFYSAMAAYREVAGIEFNDDDDVILDKWLNGADAAWKREIKSKGDRINLAEALEKAIAGGMKAVGVSVASSTRRRPEPHREAAGVQEG